MATPTLTVHYVDDTVSKILGNERQGHKNTNTNQNTRNEKCELARDSGVAGKGFVVYFARSDPKVITLLLYFISLFTKGV